MERKPRGFSDWLKDEIIAEQKGKCAICGEKGHLTIHHKVPRCEGGNGDKKNGVALCRGNGTCRCHDKVDYLTVEKGVPFEQIMQEGLDYYLSQYPMRKKETKFEKSWKKKKNRLWRI